MKRIKTLLVVAVLSSFILSSCGSSIPFLGPTMGAMNGMSSALGISTEQAIGGTAGILLMSKGILSPTDYLRLTGAIPYSNSLTKYAEDLGVPTSITGKSQLDKVFKDLGMSSDMVGKMVPEVSKYAGKKGGSDVESMLNGVFK